MKKWFVVRTKTGAEDRAVWHLENQGFQVYLPRYRKRIRHARKTSEVLRPLFPGYVFVELNLESERWRAINGTVGVVSLVQFGETPRPISDVVVDAIRAREDRNGVVSLALDEWKKGDRVRVREGAFADHEALLDEICDERRVILLLDLMGRAVRVSVPREDLVAAS